MVDMNVHSVEGEKIGEIKLNDDMFNANINKHIVHQIVKRYLAEKRRGTASTKGRSEVRGGGKKPWKQKGTGRARAGSSRSPLWIGGGVTFGPRKDRNFSKKINKKMKQKALMMVFSDRLKNNNLVVVDKIEMAEFKTKIFNDSLKKLEKNFDGFDSKKRRSVLFVNDSKDVKTVNSGRNLSGVQIINLENINIVDLLKNRNLLISESAIKKINERYSKE